VVRSGEIHGQPEKGSEGDSIVDLTLEFRIGLDLEPFLKQQTLEEKQGRVSPLPLLRLAGFVVLLEKLLDGIPVYDLIKFTKETIGSVFGRITADNQVSEGKVLFDCFVCH
jgi:hypothetical protein